MKSFNFTCLAALGGFFVALGFHQAQAATASARTLQYSYSCSVQSENYEGPGYSVDTLGFTLAELEGFKMEPIIEAVPNAGDVVVTINGLKISTIEFSTLSETFTTEVTIKLPSVDRASTDYLREELGSNDATFYLQEFIRLTVNGEKSKHENITSVIPSDFQRTVGDKSQLFLVKFNKGSDGKLSEVDLVLNSAEGQFVNQTANCTRTL